VRRAKLTQSEARVKHYLKALDATLEEYENQNPHWRVQAIFWLLESGLHNLRRWIESPKSEASWEQSIVEYHYPVNWDWNAKQSDQLQIHYGKISGDDSKAKAANVISRIIVETVIQTTLQGMTNAVALQKEGDGYRRLLPEDVVVAIEAVRGEKKREAILNELYRPWSMGATDFSLDEAVVRKAGRLPKKAQLDLKAATRRMVPSPNLRIAINGHPLILTLILQAHPLVIDVDQKRSYYPITVGFNLVPKASRGQNVLALMEEPWAQLARWARKDKDDFWTALFGVIHRWGEELKPAKPAPVEEAVLTISAKLKVSVNPANHAGTNATIDKLLRQLREAGHVIEMQHAWSQAAGSVANFAPLLAAVNSAQGSTDKGKALETLVSSLFANVDGFSIQPNQRTDTEEIDLVVVNGSNEPRWRNGTPLILVECKNWSARCGKNEVVQFRDKLTNRYGQCRLGFLVSWGGFADTVTKDLLRNSKEQALIVPLDRKNLEEACLSGEVLPTLCRAWDAAVLT